jgi:hypothetical protein
LESGSVYEYTLKHKEHNFTWFPKERVHPRERRYFTMGRYKYNGGGDTQLTQLTSNHFTHDLFSPLIVGRNPYLTQLIGWGENPLRGLPDSLFLCSLFFLTPLFISLYKHNYI